MKKRFVVLIMLVLIISNITVCSCVWEPVDVYINEMENINSVELIYYNFDEIKIVTDIKDVARFDSRKIQVKEILDKDKEKSFLNELGKIQFLQFDEFTDCSAGDGLRVNYSDGSFIIMTIEETNRTGINCGAKVFESSGNCTYIYGSFGWSRNFVELLNKYFVTQIELSY